MTRATSVLMILLTLVLGIAGTSVKASAQTKVPTISVDLKETDDPTDMVPAVKIVALLTIVPADHRRRTPAR